MATITFPGEILRSFSRDKSSTTLVFSVEMTKAIAKAMEWGDDLPDAALGCKMEGRLAGGSFVLSPKDGKQGKLPGTESQEMDCTSSSCGGFQIVRRELEQSRGNGHRHELRFKIVTGDLDAAMKAEVWITGIGDAKATLKLDYAAKAVAGDTDEDGEGE